MKNIALIMAMIILPYRQATAQNGTDVIRNSWLQYSDAENSFYHYLTGKAFVLLDQRTRVVSGIRTPEAWKERQLQVRQKIWDILGPFPEKTPLHARITGTVRKKGYTVENLIYESLPGYFVTASLFIPDQAQKPAPAILFCSGHSQEAYRKMSYQLPLLNLVKKGFIVLAIDPVGQGERLQYDDPATGRSAIGSSTKEHSYPAVQVALTGQSVARYFVWDGIRGIDYLVSRKEVDPARIGVHGISGGGTQTAYISALDDRALASAPACYITSYRRLMESIGVQDGEQNFYHGILAGIDHADFLEVRAPKPALIMATTRDFFSIQGTRETCQEVKRVYQLFGRPDLIDMTEDDFEHGYTRKIREAMYAFFQRHLGIPGKPDEEEVDYLTEQELQKTTTGQLATSVGGETLFSLNGLHAEKLAAKLEGSRQDLSTHLPQALLSAKVLSGYAGPSPDDEPVFTGRFQKEGYAVEKYFIKGQGDYVIPYLLVVPDSANGKAVIFLHPLGKSAEGSEEGKMADLIAKGFTVLVPDLPGTGETEPGLFRGDAVIGDVSYNLWFTGMLTGRSMVGIRASDVVKLARLLQKSSRTGAVYGFAKDGMCPVLLHAAAFDQAITGVILIRPYSSYRSVVMTRFYRPAFVPGLVPGALTGYDLPDLAALLAPRKLVIAGMTGGDGCPADAETRDTDLDVVRMAYQSIDAPSQLKIVADDPDLTGTDLFSDF